MIAGVGESLLPVLTPTKPASTNPANEVARGLTGRDYISWSAISTFRTCPLKSKFRYVDGLPEESVSAALVFGSGIHSAVEQHFQAILSGDPKPDLDALLFAYRSAWLPHEPDAIQFGSSETRASLDALAARMLTAFLASDQARLSGRVLGVEEEIRGMLVGGVPDLYGRVDLLTEDSDSLVVTDIKTSRGKWSQEQVEDSGEQLLLYSHWFHSWGQVRRLVEDILLAVEPYDHETDPRHARRAPTVEEIDRLLATARSRTGDQCQFFGEDRAKAYEIAIMTGYRANEIRSLTPESFSVDDEYPCITIRPTISKRRKRDMQPIPQLFVAGIREWLTGKPRGRRVFETMPGDTARMLRADLELARKAWIAEGETEAERERREQTDFLVYENSVGEFFDFHACRHAYITFISETTKSLQQAQTLARVSTPRLLDRYSHIQLHGVQQAADVIGEMITGGGHRPAGNGREAAAATLAATGTDDATADPDPATGRGASRGSTAALGGTTRHEMAGWVKKADSEPAMISMPVAAPKPRARHDLAPVGTARHKRKERGSGRSRTDDGGFAIRCLSHLATEPNFLSGLHPTHTRYGSLGDLVKVFGLN